MNKLFRRKLNQAYKKTGSSKGMTMAEMLVTVAIIMILMGVGFIALTGYQRSLAQLERDGVAKEIFVAAQNHLTPARGEGYFGISPDNYGMKNADGSYCIIVNSNSYSITDNKNHIASMMLPFGSIDETVRKGGSYIIRYEPGTGTVLDVFYTTVSESPDKFNHELTELNDSIKALGSDDKKSERKNVSDEGWILGWYGGASASELPDETLSDDLILEVENSHILSVKVTDVNQKNCTLIIEGVKSRARLSVDLDSPSASHMGRVTKDTGSTDRNVYTFVMDDITKPGMHFYDLVKDVNDEGRRFIPGEDLEIHAVSFDTDAKSNLVYSNAQTANSLYGSMTEEKQKDNDGNIQENAPSVFKVTVGNIRHLENLEEDISHVGVASEASDPIIVLSSVFQTTDIDLEAFENATGNSNKITGAGTSALSAERYYPVSYDKALLYDGLGHSISNITVPSGNYDNAGLFGKPYSGSKLKNIELIDFNISGAKNAGALAGTLNGSFVNNIIAHNSVGLNENDSKDTVTIQASEAAGGLVGLMNGGSIRYSGAALVVGDSYADNAGGLIGKVTGESSVEACYSGGHTDQGEYYDHTGTANNGKGNALYNVKGATAGGLIGSVSGDGNNKEAIVDNCYSTCSADGETVGGFVGTADNVKIDNSYCTGLVGGGAGNHDNAFIGSGSFTGSYNQYYKIINEYTDEKDAIQYKTSGAGEDEPDKVRAFDDAKGSITAVQSFNDFSGDGEKWHNTVPYDETLKDYYNGKYCFKTVTWKAAESYNNNLPEGSTSIADAAKGLGRSYFVDKHYGDWPAPEVFIVNSN